MSFRLVPDSVTLNDLERRNGVILRYFSEFGYSFRAQCFTFAIQSCSLETLVLVSRRLEDMNKNSSGDEIANVNFYAVRPEAIPEFAEIKQNSAITPFKVIQGHRFWYQSKARIAFPISDLY